MEKSILKIYANLLKGLRLNNAPFAYSFCNLGLRSFPA